MGQGLDMDNASFPPRIPKKGQKMKYVTLKEEDRQLLLHLHDFIYLHRQFVEKYIYEHYENVDSVYRRLRTLEEAGYIKAFMLPINDFDHRPSKVYTLTMFGVDIVEQMRGVTHWNRRWTTQAPPWYQHQLMIAELVKSFELKAHDVGLEFKEFVSEPRSFYEFKNKGDSGKQKQKKCIRPDGIIILGKPERDDMNLAYMIEMERSYAKREKTLRKIEQYNEFFSRYDELSDKYDRKVGFDHPIRAWKVLFIGKDESRSRKLLRDLKGESIEVPVLVASRQEINAIPYDRIYRDIKFPDELTTL